MSTITYKQVAPGDDLGAICSQMSPQNWDADNEMTQYSDSGLRKYLEDDSHILLLAWDEQKIAGAALCYVLLHPDIKEQSLYVHELDTHPDYRRRGVATGLMRYLLQLAKQRQLSEVWLGTEVDNEAANALYTSLEPYEIEPSVIYAYKVS